MSSTTEQPIARPGRVLAILQPAIVRIYRTAGLIALALIMLGLVAFVTVRVFYFFDRSWVRPVLLSQDDLRVIETTAALEDAELRRDQLELEHVAAVAELEQLDRAIATSEKFEADARALLASTTMASERLLLERAAERSRLEREAAAARRPTVVARIADLQRRAGEQDRLVARLTSSPYVLAAVERRVVAFVPYQNLGHVHAGTPLYGCRFGLVGCAEVGQVVSVLEGEVQGQSPHGDGTTRGVMVEVHLHDHAAAARDVLFAGERPFWWL